MSGEVVMPVRLIIIAKAPVPGYAKTRLIPALGDVGAAALAQRMLQHAVQQALLLQQMMPQLQIELCVAPDKADPCWQVYQHSGIQIQQQVNGDLGARMQAALNRALDDGCAAILMGTDCPALDAKLLGQAVEVVSQHQAVICPTFDGGYALLGLPAKCAAVFENMPWSTAEVYPLTLQRLQQSGFKIQQLPMQHDIDEAADLVFLPHLESGQK